MRKFDDLLVFVRVVERESFVAAARQLGMPPATVSRKVQELEKRLGVELLRRTTRKVSVTDAGQAVYERAARGLALIDEAEVIAKRHHDSPSGILRIVAPYTIGILGVEPLTEGFQRKFPDVQVHLTLDNGQLDLIEHRFDIAIRIGAQKDSSYVARRLFHGHRVLVVTPDYLAHAAPLEVPADLPSHPVYLVGPLKGESVDYDFVREGAQHSVSLIPHLWSNEGTLVVNRVLRGGGLAVLMRSLVEPYLQTGELVEALPHWQIEGDIEVFLIFRKHVWIDPKVRAFVDFAMSHIPARVPRASKSG